MLAELEHPARIAVRRKMSRHACLPLVRYKDVGQATLEQQRAEVVIRLLQAGILDRRDGDRFVRPFVRTMLRYSPAVELLGLGMGAEACELLSVAEEFDLLLAAIRRDHVEE